ncbi:hypothetical protein NR402_17990 [Acidithiobacillus ferrooxidans]|nr:hypothetical protein [Acidithiobacillus ferrooxidans]MCR2832136.1 hypothetical protein [Acidithiobacillus ferrooxidans]
MDSIVGKGTNAQRSQTMEPRLDPSGSGTVNQRTTGYDQQGRSLCP